MAGSHRNVPTLAGRNKKKHIHTQIDPQKKSRDFTLGVYVSVCGNQEQRRGVLEYTASKKAGLDGAWPPSGSVSLTLTSC